MSAVPSDEELMLRYRDGDVGAFEMLYAKHKGGVYRYLLRQTDHESAAELHQDVWLNLVKNHKRYEPSARFTTYLYKIAHNRLIDHYRSRRRCLPESYDDDRVDEAAASVQSDPAVKTQLSQQVQTLLAGIVDLPEAQREAFLLREESGLALEEIALVTGVSRETAKSRLRYAVNKLRQHLLGQTNDR